MFSPPKFESSFSASNQQKYQDMSLKKSNVGISNNTLQPQQYVNQFSATTPLSQQPPAEVANQNQSQITQNQQQQLFNFPIDNASVINNLILGYKNSKEYQQNEQITKDSYVSRSVNNLHHFTQTTQYNQQQPNQQLQRSYQKEQVTAFNPNIGGSNVKNDNSLNQSNDYINTANSAQKNNGLNPQQFQNLSTNQYLSAADYLMMSGNKIHCGNINCNCSESSWALVRDYLRQLKQMSSEHLFVSQENKRLSESNQELLNENLNLKHQIGIFEQKTVLYEKESTNKINSSKEKFKSLETFNKDLFNKITYYEQAILSYEQELKNVRQDCYNKIQQIEEEKEYLKQNLETLHDTMNDAIASSESRYKAKIDTKNSKIKQLKHQSNTDNNLIESYSTELVQLQAENQQLKNDIDALQKAFTDIQYQLEDTISSFQMKEIDLQTSFKLAEELKKKNEELSNHIALLINNQQIEGEDKLKAYQHINQQQISQLYSENQEMRKELQEWQEKAQVLKEGIEMETEKSMTLIKNMLIHMKTMIETKGKDNEEEESPYFTQQYMQFEIFDDVRNQISKLISSRHSLKKKKKALQQKIDDLKEQVDELQNTLHQVVNERQEEIMLSEQQQIQMQLLQQQQQLDQHLLQQTQLQNRQLVEDTSPINQQQIQQNMSAQSTPISYMQRVSIKTALPQSQMHAQNNLLNAQNWIEDATIQHNRGSQMMSFQNTNLNTSLPKVSSGDLQHIRKSLAVTNNSPKLNTDFQNQANTVQNQLLFNSQESDYARFQGQIDEILALKEAHYGNTINELREQLINVHTNESCLVYILSKVIQNLSSRIVRLNNLLKQQTNIVFAFVDSFKSQNANNKKSSVLDKFRAVVNQIIFIKKLKSIKESKTSRSSLKLLSLNLDNIKKSRGLKRYIESILKDLEGDFGLYSSVRQITEGSDHMDNNLSLQTIKFKQNNFEELINLLDNRQNEYEQSSIAFQDQIQIYEVEINPTNILKSERQESNSNQKNELIKEKEIIETENIQLKNLVINLKEENEEIKNKITEQNKNYSKVIENYEMQIQKLQNENEIHLEKNSKLIDLIDPKNRVLLEQQPFLNDINYDDFLDSQDQNVEDLIPSHTNNNNNIHNNNPKMEQSNKDNQQQ